MRSNYLKTMKTAVLAVMILLLGASAAMAQTAVSLTAMQQQATLPDGQVVPMWGLHCTAGPCTSLHYLDDTTGYVAQTGGTVWEPPLIIVPYSATTGASLSITLTNALPAGVPTSLVIVGQLGGGLGNSATTVASPPHPEQQLTWPVAGVSGVDPTNTPPHQGPRVQSFGTEVPSGTTTSSPLQWTNLRPGTYLLESGTHPSIQGPMGLYGIVVVTTAPTTANSGIGTAYPAQDAAGGVPLIPAVTYTADLPLLLSEIDPVQNRGVDQAVNTAGFLENTPWSGQLGQCGDPAVHNCYPPAVNYTPLYYLVNGVAFNKSSAGTAATSMFSAAPRSATGNVLVRLVNAGLRMHVPSIVGSLTGIGSPAASGFTLIAEDSNPLPGVPRVQSQLFMAAGKTYDVMINKPATANAALPIFDRALGLSANATSRDAGMLAYIGVDPNLPNTGTFFSSAKANLDVYPSFVAGQTVVVSDPAKGVLANDVNITNPVAGTATNGTVTLNSNGTFTFVAAAAQTSGSFTYCGNGAAAGDASLCTTVNLSASPTEALNAITLNNDTYTSRLATRLEIKEPGVLANDTDTNGYPLSVVTPLGSMPNGLSVSMNANGSFSASATAPGTYTFTYSAKSSRGTPSSSTATVTLIFPNPSNLIVNLIDGSSHQPYAGNNDYRWIIEEDRTFYIDPRCQTNPIPTGIGCPGQGSNVVPTFGVNFHTSYMPVVAQGCTGPISCETGQTFLNPETGTHDPAVCDQGNGVCRASTDGKTPVLPGEVALDPAKRYYISILPGDAVGVDGAGHDTDTSHQMGGAQIAAGQKTVNVIVEQQNQQPGKVSVFVFRDDHPLNGEHDAGGGLDVLSPNEPGLGGFNITIFDDVGGTGDAAGQMTYDEFGQPLSNALAGTIDPVSGVDACYITTNPRTGIGEDGVTPTKGEAGITGMIPVCPNYESDGITLSPLAGQAVVNNMPPGRYGIVATPGADRIVLGEEWLQTNTLDGGKAHDSFLKAGEPSYFQEFGPAGYHVAIGFANPAFIKAVGADLCNGNSDCSHTLTSTVTGVHMSRPSDERLYSTGNRDTFGYTQCYASLGSVDGADFKFAKCDENGTFTLNGVPSGDWRLTIFDQWNDQIVDGISTSVTVGASGSNLPAQIAVHAWKQNLYTRSCFDMGGGAGIAGDGICQPDEQGLALIPTNIRFRDGSISNLNSTDLEGYAGFNEIFPLFNWYILEGDSTRYKNTGVHVVNDAGGPTDGDSRCGQAGYPACGTSTAYQHMARTKEDFPLPDGPNGLRFPGSVYCNSADCNGKSIQNPAGSDPSGPALSTGRIDPGWVTTYGWQGFAGQNQFLEFAKVPFNEGENGGIRGHVIYTSTRPFDDPALLLQLTWEPMVPGVTINLYQVADAPDGSRGLKLVDTTKTSSWDDWAQGFWPGTTPAKPYMSCPGQAPAPSGSTPGDIFFFTLMNQPNYLNPGTALPNSSQYKCYDGMHNWAQLQPAPYDGMYQFPSVTGRSATTGAPTGTNCTICVPNPTDGTPMLPSIGMTLADGSKATGRYVVEMIVPPGYELVKEEDKNILLGDAYEGAVPTQFAGFGNIFIMPDQATVAASYNPNNPLIPSTNEGVTPRHEGDTGSVETFWPCVGAQRIVPDYMSLFPGSGQNAPFAGAKRSLCDRKEVVVEDQMTVLAKFYVFSSTHVAGHFTGIITDDFTSEFDPFSPHFGEKFSPANLPVAVKSFNGNEVARVYSDWWGIYDGLNYSTFSVNPPDPSGYIPSMMVMCMNDRGTNQAYDPFYQESYSQFCYELPFMPGQTGYFDTPVIPTTAFAEGYNHPDCAYPDHTPAIKEVDGDGIGPWVGVGSTSVASLTPVSAGTGYTSAPASFNITHTPNPTTVGTGQITGLKLVSISNFACSTVPGSQTNCSRYALHPTVVISGGGGSGATATATKSGTNITFVVTNPGSGYTSRPNITISRTTGTPTSLNNNLKIMGVDSIALTSGGSGYTGGTFNFTIVGGGGNNATASAALGTSTQTLTITALGDQTVNNYGYSGPATSTTGGATTQIYRDKTVLRHYGFGGAAGTVALVGSDGVSRPLTNVSWSDTVITGTVPAGVPACSVQQQAQYGGSPASCGQLVIIAADGKPSIDTVTVTIGGKAPTHIAATESIQAVIDAAAPGDLLMVDPTCTITTTGANPTTTNVPCNTTGVTGKTSTTHSELLIMWKPVRLQGAGAASTILNADPHPAGKLDPWRQQVVCLFGLGLDGRPESWLPGCAGDNWQYFKPAPNGNNLQPQVDRLPLEATVGWEATLNGNLAEQLQEPSLMGAYEGAGITVLAKGVNFQGGDPWTDGAEPGGFPTSAVLLNNSTGTTRGCGSGSNPSGSNGNLFPSNFYCNPSRIDGLTIANSSQGGGGIFVHGWAHNLEISNNRVTNNQGTLAGGITVGQGEHPPAYLGGAGAATNAAPGSCQSSNTDNLQLPYCFDVNVNIHHNAVTTNSSEGDELFSATPSGAGGVAFCTGADSYKFNNNWVCGNLSTGDGAGISQLGYVWDGRIEHNAVLFNQATNPTTPSNGGGVLIMGAPDTDPSCPGEPDTDCNLRFGTVGDGTGRNLLINANLILGNAADAGAGGGLRLQAINGMDVSTFPTRPDRWYAVTVTNNIIANNVAGWDGAGVSLQDALVVNLVNNTIVDNDSTAASGVLFDSFFASQTSSPTPCTQGMSCIPDTGYQPSGVSSARHSAELIAALPNNVTVICPAGHTGATNNNPTTNGNCKRVSIPILYNDVIWHNRSFRIALPLPNVAAGAQQRSIALQPPLNQSAIGQCFDGTSKFWDIGFRGDTWPDTIPRPNHNSTFTHRPQASFLTDITDYAGGGIGFRGNTTGPLNMVAKAYCNGSRVPPENGSGGYITLPGTNESNVPVPVFSLTPAATVDEGNNWVNITWGPLSLNDPANGAILGNYALSGAAGVGYITNGNSSVTYGQAPDLDYFGNARKTNSSVDVGAVEFTGTGPGGPPATVAIAPNPLTITIATPVANVGTGTGNVTFTNTSTVASGSTVTISNVAVNSGAGSGILAWFFTKEFGQDNCTGVTLQPQQSCTVRVRFTNTGAAVNVDRPGTIVFTDNATGSPQTGNLVGHANP